MTHRGECPAERSEHREGETQSTPSVLPDPRISGEVPDGRFAVGAGRMTLGPRVAYPSFGERATAGGESWRNDIDGAFAEGRDAEGADAEERENPCGRHAGMGGELAQAPTGHGRPSGGRRRRTADAPSPNLRRVPQRQVVLRTVVERQVVLGRVVEWHKLAVDAVKMAAYRAETKLVELVGPRASWGSSGRRATGHRPSPADERPSFHSRPGGAVRRSQRNGHPLPRVTLPSARRGGGGRMMQHHRPPCQEV